MAMSSRTGSLIRSRLKMRQIALLAHLDEERCVVVVISHPTTALVAALHDDAHVSPGGHRFVEAVRGDPRIHGVLRGRQAAHEDAAVMVRP